jgi:LuxR family maltose regulon positive regulatory protein
LRPPAPADHLVRRARLLELLDQAVVAPLTLVVAPAGSGKTSLLAGWTAESAMPTAWLSLDEADRDPAQLWTGVLAAVETLLPGVGERAMRLVLRPGALRAAISVLLDDLEAQHRSASVLIIDDAHVLEDEPDAVASLSLFVQHLPPWLHVVLLARRNPPLPIDRLRARGQLGEVHFPELRFSQREAEDMLSRLAPSLEADRLVALACRAGGWAAGIQLAAIAARSSRAQVGAMGASPDVDHLVEDYVWREVLTGESPELVEVLVDTAVVERVDASLGRALTGRADAAELLARAEARGLFVSRLDPPGWFGVHSLVREVLLGELARRSSTRLSEQHLRAARWFEEAGEVPLALEHWLLAGRPRDALRLLAVNNAALYDSGREATITRTIAGVPPNVATADIDTMLDFAWCHVLVDRHRFLQTVDELTEWVTGSTELDAAVWTRLTMLQAIAATIRGDWAAGGHLAETVIRRLGESWWTDPLGRFSWNMIARDIALSERWDDAGAGVCEVRRALGRDPERRLAFEGTHALGEALTGQAVDALRVAAGVRQAAAVLRMTILRAELSVAEAIAHRELGDRPRAIEELLRLADTPAEPAPYCQVLAYLELAQARLDGGELESAERAFGEAAQLVGTEFSGPGGRAWLARVGALVALAAGRIDEAQHWAEEVDDRFWGGATIARVCLARGDRAAAAAALDRVTPRCVRHEVVRDLLRSRAVETHEEAVKYVTSAVERAAAAGLLQTVASEGGEALALVELAAWRAPRPWLDRLRRAAAPSLGPLQTSKHLVGTLTEREREVLRLLPSRLTLREIAGELSISLNTLKFHLRIIYRKLGCSSRAEAADMARAVAGQRRPNQGPNTFLR